MIGYILLAILTLFPMCLYAQSNSIDDAQAMHALMIQSMLPYRDGFGCPCPYSIIRDGSGRRCGSLSVWSRTAGAYPYCYPHDIPYSRIIEYKRLHGSGSSHPASVVSQVIRHHESSGIVARSGIDHNKLTFVFNGVLYHPMTQEGCGRIIVGTPLTLVHVTAMTKERFGSHGVIFRLPDGSRCLAMSLGPANF